MEIKLATILTITGMALATYVTRAGGLWLMRLFPIPSRFEAALRHIPGAVLIALIAPSALGRSPAETVATLITIIVSVRTNNVLLSMLIGVLSVLVLRKMLL